MSPHNVYVSAGPQVPAQPGPSEDEGEAQDATGQILKDLSRQALKGRRTLEEVKRAFGVMNPAGDEREGDDTGNPDTADGRASAIKRLREAGYVRDGKKWLTKKGFDAIGRMILRDIMRDAKMSRAGEHPTGLRGKGEITMDTARRYEFGDDPKSLSVQDTLLNAISRPDNRRFPLNVAMSDMAVYETYSDVHAAVVYCIDLSSTMKTKTGGVSRIESAKKALWGLYGAGAKFFPSDQVHIVGFASMASRIKPHDIPYLSAFDANEYLHYTNYQAALRLSARILAGSAAGNKKIVLITDGQPSACYVENDYQRDLILSEKPYSNFYSPGPNIIEQVRSQKSMRLDVSSERQVYLCYRYKKVDSRIHAQTVREAQRCRRAGIGIDAVVITDEQELVEYGKDFARQVKGTMFHIPDGTMATTLVRDYMGRTGAGMRHGL